MKNKIVVIEDGKTINIALSEELRIATGKTVLSGFNMQDCIQLVDTYKEQIIVAISCLYLPGANEGDTIDYLLANNIPVVVLTGNYNEEMRQKLFKKKVSDYYFKENISTLSQVVAGIDRLIKNYGSHVAVVDASRRSQSYVGDLLIRQLLQPHYVHNTDETLELLKSNKSIRLVMYAQSIGLDLLKKLRQSYSKEKLSVIVVADEEEKYSAPMFIKYGANEYLQKPFCNESFITKVGSQLEIIELFQMANDRANRDFMTGMFNRRYFFDEGMQRFNRARKEQVVTAVAMIDIDKFKRINDTYGHDIGDIAIKEVAKILAEKLNPYDALISRFGGEEFCMILFGIEKERVIALFEEVRIAFEENVINVEEVSFSYTVSIGLHFRTDETLDEAVKKADAFLYAAKENGRNQVIND